MMTPQDFTYWLQGFDELNEGPPSAEQWQSIREHLALTFIKVTPPVRSPSQYQLGQLIYPQDARPVVSTC